MNKTEQHQLYVLGAFAFVLACTLVLLPVAWIYYQKVVKPAQARFEKEQTAARQRLMDKGIVAKDKWGKTDAGQSDPTRPR